MTVNIQTNLPILIVSTPRSGSTLFLEILKYYYPTYEIFGEPESSIINMNNLETAIHTSTKFVAKIHIGHLYSENDKLLIYKDAIRDFLLSDCVFRISIKRRNVIQQTVSRYIARSRQMWMYNKDNICNYTDTNDVSLTLMIDCLKYIKRQRILQDSIKVDKVVYYEDIITELAEYQNLQTPQPTNYLTLVELATDLFNRC